MTDFAAARIAMVDCQVRPSDVTRFPIIEAMLTVPREAYVPPARRAVAYVGEHVEMGGGRVLLDPRVLAKMLDALDIQPGERVLDIGCLQGYSTAVLARIGGQITGVEQDPEMAMFAEANLAGNGVENATVLVGKLTEGAKKAAPFDVILVNGGIAEFPQALEQQLREGGRAAAIFMDGATGQARLGLRSAGDLVWRRAFDATAPLLPGFSKISAFQF